MGWSQTGLQRETMKIEQGSEWIQMVPLTAAVFYRNGGNVFVIIAVTVDDLTITASRCSYTRDQGRPHEDLQDKRPWRVTLAFEPQDQMGQ